MIKAIRRKNELIWGKTRNTMVNYDVYFESCIAVKNANNESKAQIFQNKKFRVTRRHYSKLLTPYFYTKIDTIRAEFPLLEDGLSPFISIDSII